MIKHGGHEFEVPKVDKISYMEIKTVLGETIYRLVCPCGNCDPLEYGSYITYQIVEDERGRKHSYKVLKLLCNKCKSEDTDFNEYQKQFKEALAKSSKKTKATALINDTLIKK